jgi:hypothetical protein
LGEEFALVLRASKKSGYKKLKDEGSVVVEAINDFEKKAALYLMKDKGYSMLGVGDKGVREVLKIPDIERAPDFLSITKSGGLALSEVKGGTTVDAGHAVSQLENALKKLKGENLLGDVDRVEIIMKKGASLGNNYGTKDGYLVNKITGKPILMDGFPLIFIKVVEI